METESGGDSEGVNSPATRGAWRHRLRRPPRPRPARLATPRRAAHAPPVGLWDAASLVGSPAICRGLGAASPRLGPRVFIDTERGKAREFVESVQGAYGAGGAARSRGGGWGGTRGPSYTEPPGRPSCFAVLRFSSTAVLCWKEKDSKWILKAEELRHRWLGESGLKANPELALS